jgi:pectate lyase
MMAEPRILDFASEYVKQGEAGKTAAQQRIGGRAITDSGPNLRGYFMNCTDVLQRITGASVAASGLIVLAAAAGCGAQNCVGWATADGNTTGGAGGTAVIVTSQTDLVNYARSAGPMVIRVRGKISASRVNIASNKTIEGDAPGATIDGSLYMYGKSDARLCNIIIRNLVIANETGSEADVVSMQFADHVWIDHCDISDRRSTLDGLCDMTHAVDNVTISWTIFSYPGSAPDHRFCMLISHSDDNVTEDSGRLRITLHHNWWSNNNHERMPRMRFGKVHTFNNYFSCSGNNYCIGAGVQAQVRVESNCFERVDDPHIFYNGEATAVICTNNDNQYINTTGARDQGHGSCFTVPYQYTLDPGATVKSLVMAGAGPFRPVRVVEPEERMPVPVVVSPAAGSDPRPFAVTLKGTVVPQSAVRSAAPYVIVTDKPRVRCLFK